MGAMYKQGTSKMGAYYGAADVFQSVVSRLMGQSQPPDIEQGVEDPADGDSGRTGNWRC